MREEQRVEYVWSTCGACVENSVWRTTVFPSSSAIYMSLALSVHTNEPCLSTQTTSQHNENDEPRK